MLTDPRKAVAEDEYWVMTEYGACCGSLAALVRQTWAETIRRRPEVVLAGHANLVLPAWLFARGCSACLVSFTYGVDTTGPLASALILRPFALGWRARRK